jgi:glycosyltransferase involved in cell wall biosynthesis
MSVTLSIVMPVFNEQATLAEAIQRLLDVEYPCPTELIIVNDGSRDGTAAILDSLVRRDGRRIRVFEHVVNMGKGAAVRTGVDEAQGTHLIVLDGDLEYDPADIVQMLHPVLAGKADHVFGARVRGMNTCFRSFRFAVGGRFTTLVTNIAYDACLTDMHTCLKLVPVSHFRALSLNEDGFGLDTEVTVRLLRAGVRPFEVPVSYHGRSVADGKKISWRDGLRCLSIVAKVRVARAPQVLPAARADAAVLRLLNADASAPDTAVVELQVVPDEVRIPPLGAGLRTDAAVDPADDQISVLPAG